MFLPPPPREEENSATLEARAWPAVPASPPPSPTLMKDMWWSRNSIVCQICLVLAGSGSDLAVVWVDRQIICHGWRLNPIIQSGSQEADSTDSWPTARPHRADLDLTVSCPAVNPTGRPISATQRGYFWTTVMMTERLKSISRFSKRPPKDNYSFPLSFSLRLPFALMLLLTAVPRSLYD